jgi:hypothetical protein
VDIIRLFKKSYTKKVDAYYALHGIWPQNIFRGGFSSSGGDSSAPEVFFHPYSNGISHDLCFPLSPPLTHKCKVVGLKEPLKVRTITAGQCESKVLKPLQKAFWEALQRYPCFVLTGGKFRNFDSYEDVKVGLECIELALNSLPDPKLLGPEWYYLSGDYTGATDNFSPDMTREILEGILSQINHKPTADWARWECSMSELTYPFGRFDQTSGQLMGSILSFPLLCLGNLCLCLMAGLEESKLLINGDDLAAVATEETIQNWYREGNDAGIIPTVGKTYEDREFITVNSQIFYNDGGDNGLLNTGKFSLLCRKGKGLASTFCDSQRLYGNCLRTWCPGERVGEAIGAH